MEPLEVRETALFGGRRWQQTVLGTNRFPPYLNHPSDVHVAESGPCGLPPRRYCHLPATYCTLILLVALAEMGEDCEIHSTHVVTPTRRHDMVRSEPMIFSRLGSYTPIDSNDGASEGVQCVDSPSRLAGQPLAIIYIDPGS